MDYLIILKATASLAGAGLVMGLGLAVASKKFHVEIDPRLERIIEALPGTNCGACGYPGCQGAAEAILQGRAKPGACTAGGHEVAEHIASIIGADAGEARHAEVAFVHCFGGQKNAKNRFESNYPVKDCVAESLIAGGHLACSFGCLGFGNCAAECPFDAIEMAEGLPKVDFDKCTSCGICVSACPRNLFTIDKLKNPIYMGCTSTDKGKDVRKACKVGCIACKICEKECPKDAIHVIDNLAVIDYKKCDGCLICVEKCPTKCIIANK
ncbi:MAG: RnfABCDGE type electron transport complex subunit B [Actinobacteria bacterium]|nr:MAG: RnfABCDGE type electron transport complex subunit B [Actinomycetota bacterium]